jgi:hypothetical protein
MTIASNPATPIVGNVTTGHAPAPSPAQTALGQMLSLRIKRELRLPLPVDPLARHIAIENALSMALWHVRHSTDTTSLHAATGRAIRAASMLKQACAESSMGEGSAA